jgi:superfamily II DNA helicase RecQ
MRTKVLTLRYSPQLGGFDESPLLALQQKVVLTQLREHLVTVGGEPLLVCVAEWREQQQAASAANLPARDAAAPETPLESAAPAMAAACPCPQEAARTRAARPVGALRADLTADQRASFDRLRAWRSKIAHADGAPPFLILTNRQLVDIVRQRPQSKAALGRIKGLGEKKLARHGDALLHLLQAEGERGAAGEGHGGNSPEGRRPAAADHPTAAQEPIADTPDNHAAAALEAAS